MSGLEIATSIVTFVSALQKVADGISRLSGLRHAPDALLALNNEVADLQCIIVSHSINKLQFPSTMIAQCYQEDLSELKQQNNAILANAITPSFQRAFERSQQLLLDLEKLIAYELTTFDDRTGRLRVDRSAWLQTQEKVDQAKSRVRLCRMELSTAVNLLTSYIKIGSVNSYLRLTLS